MRRSLLVIFFALQGCGNVGERSPCARSFLDPSANEFSGNVLVGISPSRTVMIFNLECPERIVPISFQDSIESEILSDSQKTPPFEALEANYYITYAVISRDHTAEGAQFEMAEYGGLRQIERLPAWMD